MEGSIQFFRNDVGYGYINDNLGRNIFVSCKEMALKGIERINKGDIVQFDLYDSPLGLIAKNVIKKL